MKALGLSVVIESGYGENLGYADQNYKDFGAEILSDPKEILSKSNLICKVNLPSEEEIKILKKIRI